MTTRKQFLTIAGGGLLQLSISGQAHAQANPRRIGFLSALPRRVAEFVIKAILVELKKLGWTDGDDIMLLELRLTEGRHDRLPKLAAELVAEAPDVIFVNGTAATLALMHATKSIPIVMSFVGNPVDNGIVKSLAKPAGNITGAAYLADISAIKLMDLLKEAIPRLQSVVVFIDPSRVKGAVKSRFIKVFKTAVAALGMRVQVVEASESEDFELAFAAIRNEKAESILLLPAMHKRTERAAVAEFAQRHRLPLTVVGTGSNVPAGCLIAYAPAFAQYPPIAARQIDRILKGADPGDIPVEQPTQFELTVNKKAAESIGITIPASIMLRANKIIE